MKFWNIDGEAAAPRASQPVPPPAMNASRLAAMAPYIHLRGCRASRAIEKLMARSASGVVELTGGARNARCDTSSGEVRLSGLLGPVGIATTSGNIVARFDALQAGDEIHITTTSGRVAVALPPGCQPGGELVSTKGEIRSSFPGLSDPKTIRLGLSGTGPKVFVTTTSSRIQVF